MTRHPHVVLLGGGYAHLHVVRSLQDQAWPARVTLVSPRAVEFYSGMIPGYLQGVYDADEIRIDLGELCRRGGVQFVEATALVVDTARLDVSTDRGLVGFDLLSLDVGSVPRGLDISGVREHALSLRPLRNAVRLRTRLDEVCSGERGPGTARVLVVGAGAAGIEVALAAHRRIEGRGGRAAVGLIEAAPDVLPDDVASTRRNVRRLLRDRGIELRTGSEVASVTPAGVVLADGDAIEADLVIWMAGPAPPPLVGRSALPSSGDGYFAVDATLRARDGAPVWGAGDCARVDGYDLPRAGVHAVRQGPILLQNLRAAVAGGRPVDYRPRGSVLSLLNTADGKALLRWNGIAFHSRLAWWLKNWIDRRFIARYR